MKQNNPSSPKQIAQAFLSSIFAARNTSSNEL
jgi:hypothetical protein